MWAYKCVVALQADICAHFGIPAMFAADWARDEHLCIVFSWQSSSGRSAPAAGGGWVRRRPAAAVH